MQTFVPMCSYAQSAKVLYYRRLGKQRVECKQLYNALTGKSTGWANHPAAKMWMGNEYGLLVYASIICEEWIRRGYKDQQLSFFNLAMQKHDQSDVYPSWWGGSIHASHRSNLLRKDPDWYGQFNWSEPDDMEYVWP